MAERIIANSPLVAAPTLWRGEEVARKVKVGDTIDLHARSASTDRDISTEFAFGTSGDAETSVLIQIKGAKGVDLTKDSAFNQGEWLVAGKFRVVSVQKDEENEIDQLITVVGV